MSLTPQLLNTLPEAVWPIAARRLWLMPSITALAEKEPAVLNAWLKTGHTPENWKPGRLALAAYAALHPEVGEDAEGWLMNDGRELLSAAYHELTDTAVRQQPTAPETVTVMNGLLAALALRVRGEVTTDWEAMAHEASAQPERWRWPLQILFGLLNDPQPLYTALLQTSPAAAELAAQCLVVNCNAEAAFTLAQALTPPAHHQLRLVKTLQALGEEALARRLAGIPTQGGDLAQKAELLAATSLYAQAQPALAAARQDLRQRYLQITAQLGQLAAEVGEHGVALAAFQAVLDEEPAQTEAQLAAARALLALNEPEQALEALRAAPEAVRAVVEAQALVKLKQVEDARERLAALPTEALTLENATLAAEVWQELKEPRRAAEAWQRAAQLTNQASAFHHASCAFAESGDWLNAHTEAAEAAVRAPHLPEIREQLGLCLLEVGQAASAIPHFQAALAYAPKRLSATLGLARAALAAQQLQLAHDSAANALTHSPTLAQEAEAHVILGETLSALGQESEAFEHFSRASALAPTNPGPWRAMAKHHRTQNETEQAVAALEAGWQALKLAQSSESAALLVDLGEAYTAVGRLAEAISALREACAVEPHSARPYRQLGLLLRRTGQTKEAVEALRLALSHKPGEAMILHELGLALEETQQPREAWAMFQQAVLAQPADFAPYFDLGRATLEQLAQNNPDAQAAQAIHALKKAVARSSENADAHALLARAYQLNHQPKEALASYQNALRLAPHRTEWSLGFGQVCLQLNQPEVAVAALQEALTYAPHDVQVQTAYTEACLQAHLWPEAIQNAEAALRFDPNNARLYGLQAEALAHLGQMPAAARAWEKAIHLAPRDATVRLHYARCLINQHQIEEARDVLAQALAIAPDSVEAHLTAGKMLMDLNETESALEALRQATELAPHRAEAQAALGAAAMQAKNFEAAHAAYLRAAELNTIQLEYLREAGEAAWQLGRNAAAIALWEKVIAQNPLDVSAQAQLGRALLNLGQAEEALHALEQALSHQPENATLAREAAEAALAAGFLPQAETYLQMALNRLPYDAEAHLLLGQVREQQANPQQALALYEQATQLNPNEGRYHAAAGAVLAQQGQWPEAVQKMRRAMALSPESPIVQQRAGEIFLQAGELNAASEAFTRWVSLQPQAGAAYLALGRALTLQAEHAHREVQAGITAPINHSQVLAAFQQAAALGADPEAVRYWLSRAKAMTTPNASDFLHIAPPPSAIHHFCALGAALRQTGQLEQAREALQAALEKGEPPVYAYIELGLTHAALKDGRGAVVAFKRAVAADTQCALAHYFLAEALANLNDQTEAPSTAAQVLTRALTLRPAVAAWHYKLGEWLLARGEAGALGHLQQAVALEPENGAYNTVLARGLLRDGDLNGAAKCFRRATETLTEDGVLWSERGQTHLALRDYATAAEAFERALTLLPGHVPALLGAAQVSLALGKVHLATSQAETALRIAPHNPLAQLCVGDVAAARGDVAEAEKAYLNATNSEEAPAAWLALGKLRLSQGKGALALEALRRAAQGKPTSDEILSILGDAYVSMGDYAQAVQAYREATRLAPRHAPHFLKLGRVLRSHGQLDQAITQLLQARDLLPNSDEVLREIGLVFEQRKQFDRALEMYQLAIKSAPRCAINYARAGVALRNLKDYTGSVQALERAVALEPHNLEATRQLAAVTALHIMHSEPLGHRVGA